MQLESQPIQSMEYRLELKKNSRDQPPMGTSDKTKFSQANQKKDLPDRFKLERHNLSYADLHHEVIKNMKDFSPKFSGNLQKKQIDRKGNEEDELVKYMSRVPSYLEKGKNPQEKVLNVGVLDWGRLEKWQCSHKQMLRKGSGSSISGSNFSSSFSTDASSSRSSSGYISPPCQKTRHSSLQFHLMSSSMDSYSQAVKSSGDHVQRFPDIIDAQSNSLNVQGKFTSTEKPFGKNNVDMLEECKKKDSNPKIDRENGTLANGVEYEVASSTKLKMKTQDGNFMKKTEKLQERKLDVVEQDVGKQKPVVLLLPKDHSKNDLSGVSSLSNMTTMIGQRPAEDRRRSFSGRPKDVELVCDFPHSSPVPCKGGRSEHLQMKWPNSTDAKNDTFLSERSHQAQSAAETVCWSGDRNLEDRKSTVTINKSTSSVPSVGLDLKANKVAPEKVRTTSPFRRLSFSMSRISKNSGSKEASALQQSNSTYLSAHSGSENSVVSSHLDTCGDKINSTNRARSSPLRRLLDPVLKPKGANCHNIGDPLPKDSMSKERASKYSDDQPYSSSSMAASSGRVKADMARCGTINVNDSLQEKQHGSRAVQALLRVAVKNGQPLFTFAVDNERDILAATMKKLSTSGKDYSCCYTFFTIQEVKKKKGRWLNHGGKAQSHDFIPNVVAQMNVCGSHFSELTAENNVNQFSVREFVLASVHFRQTDQQMSDFEPNDELAAIVVKIPLLFSRSLLINGYKGTTQEDLRKVGLKEYFPEVTLDSDSGKKVQNWPYVGCQDISATIILPSGVHTVPKKGEPSSLIQRWRTGGSCDCGGWDLGCKLKILANWNQLMKKAGSSNACSSEHRFDLFSEVIHFLNLKLN